MSSSVGVGESDRWFTTIDNIKSAFKDESVVGAPSNVALANHSINDGEGHEDLNSSMDFLERLQSSTSTGNLSHMSDKENSNIEFDSTSRNGNSCNSNAIIDEKPNSNNGASSNTSSNPSSMANVDDEMTYRSFVPSNTDRYDPGYISPKKVQDESDIPDIVNVSSIRSDINATFNISLSQDEDMRNLLNPKIGQQVSSDESYSLGSRSRDEESSSANTGSTTDGGSLLLNLWNEDYDGNPDPEVVKKLMNAKRLPRNLDPYVVNQIERAKIIRQLEEIDDSSSDGSCNVVCTHFFLPRRCADDDDISVCSDDSIVDTVINFDRNGNTDAAEDASNEGSNEEASEKSEIESCHSEDLYEADFKHRKPKQTASMYALPKDSEYRPGVARKELVLMLPKRAMEKRETERKNEIEAVLPLQYAQGDKDIENDLSRLSKSTYYEKDIEFSPQNVDNEANNNEESDAAESNLTSPQGLVVDLEKLSYREKRRSDDDDPIEEDRSVLSPEELEALENETYDDIEIETKQTEDILANCMYQPTSPRKVKQDPLSQIIDIFNNKQSCAFNITQPSLEHINCNNRNINIDGCGDITIHQADKFPKIKIPTNNATINRVADMLKPQQDEFKALHIEDVQDQDDKVECDEESDVEDNEDGPLIMASSTVESLELNPVDDNMRQVESLEIDVVDEKLRSSQEENYCPNSSSQNLDTNDDFETLKPISEESDNMKEESSQEKKVSFTTPSKFTAADRVLKNLGEMLDRNTREAQKKVESFVKMSSRNRSYVTNSISKDENLEDLINIDDITIDPTRTDSLLDESAEVVMGVTVEGVRFKCPSGEFGMIIDPKDLEETQSDENIDDENDDDFSQTSEQYTNMILDVTQCEGNEDEKMMNNYYSGSVVSEATTHHVSNLDNTKKSDVDSTCGKEVSIKNDLMKLKKSMERNAAGLGGGSSQLSDKRSPLLLGNVSSGRQ